MMLPTLPPRLRRYKSRALLSAGLLLGSLAAAAQTSLYNFQNVSGQYVPLASGATLFAINGGGGADGDDAYSAVLPLPFGFPFGGSTYSTVIVNSNGFLGLGGSANTTNFNVDMFTSPSVAYDHTIAFAGVDLKNTATVYRWRVDGTAPDRIWKMEASNFDRFNGLGQTGSAQVWLYESGQIDIVYGTFSNLWDPAFLSFEVGLRGTGVADVKTIGGTWAAPVASNAATTITTSQTSIPTPGQTFRFSVAAGTDLTPPTIGPVTATPAGSACTAQAHTFSIQPTDASGVASAAISYSVGSGAAQTVAMTNNSGTWSGTIPAQGADPVVYTISVTDASPQANVATTAPASYADAQVTVDAGNGTTITTGQTTTLMASVPSATALKITEVTLNGVSTGATTPRPSYILANDDDFVEISNTSSATIRLAGYRFETRSLSGLGARTYTFPPTAILPDHGVLVLHLGPGTDDAANRYFHAGGTNDSFFSGADAGLILYTPAGAVVDAVALNGYSFSSDVTAADWSTPPSIGLTGGTAGASLLGQDLNNGTHWQVASLAVPQTLGTYNSGISDAAMPAVTWTGGVLTAPVTANPLTTPVHPTAGTFTYMATYTADGCTVTDDVVVTVIDPVTPVADFSASTMTPAVGQTVTFTDQSTNLPGSWQWSFAPSTVTYVNGTSATSQNPEVTFNTPGCYNVTLTATNGAGSDTETKASYVCAALAYCTTNLQQNACASFTNWINTVSIAGTALNNANTGCNSNGGNSYVSWPASGATTATLVGGQAYTLSVTTNSVGTTAAWLDFNANGQFETSEYLLVQASGQANQPATVSFTVPANAPGGQVLLRVRNSGLSNSIAAGDACVLRFSGETEDYTVTLQAGCANPPTAGFGYPGTANGVCSNSTQNLLPQLASGATAGTFSASDAGLSIDPVTGEIDVANSAAATYTIYNTVAASGGCPAALDSTTLTIEQLQSYEIQANGATTFCAGDSVELSVRQAVRPGGTGSVSIATYTWMLNGQPIAGATDPTYTATQAGDYTVTVETAAGCSSTTQPTTVTVNPPQSAAFTYGGTSFCLGGPNPVPTISGTAGGTFTGSGSLEIDANTGEIDLNGSGSGTYTVVYTTPGPCSDADTVLVTLLTAPSAAFSYGGGLSCAGSPGTLAPAIAPGAAAGTFSANSPDLAIDPATGVIDLGASAAGLFWVYNSVAASGSCPAATDSVAVILEETPRFHLTAHGPTTFCAGGSVVLAAAPSVLGGRPGGIPAFSFQFLLNGQPIAGAFDSTYTATQAGLYSVIVTSAAGCSGTTDTLQVTLTAPQAATFAYGAATFCLSATTNPVPVITGAAGGTFSTSATTGLALDPATGTIDLGASATGTYTVTYTTPGPCAGQDSVTITLTTAPLAAFSYPATAPCAGTAGTLAPTLGTGAVGGTFGASPAGLTLDPATGAITIATSAAGTYTVTNTVVPASGCAGAVDSATVVIEAVPVVSVAVSGPLTFCAGDSVVLTASGGGVFMWNTGPNTARIVVRQSGDYFVTVLNNAGCEATSDTISVVVTPLASAAFAFDTTTYCLGGPNPVATVTGTAGGTFSAPAGLSIDPATGIIDLNASMPGTYPVTYTVAGACGASSTQSVTLLAAPQAAFAYDNAAGCAGSAGMLNVNIAPGAMPGTFTAAPTGLTIDAATGAIDLSTSAAGTYTVTNTVTGTAGCSDVTATTTVTIDATPAQPTFTAAPQGSGIVILTSSSATGNQWFFNGTPIAGATAQTYTVTAGAQSGTYTVQVTNGTCASVPSDPQTITITGTAADAPAARVQLYPNPTRDGLVTVEVPAPAAATALTVFDAAGRAVYRTVLAAGAPQAHLDLHHLPTGVYAVRIGTAVRRLVRE